ncbi:sulfurtransferase [Aureispira anguillae]|uniref:Sulfurtransferase n=1 Tax=Aureispira anguillae TaxID=2864201 RepID=A0A915YBI1_9BACT|nr:rhodanese-like domain-containing protein [Aureispira anguillae]BDS10024.1 rhodanese-like domain-containing protein [Aureispira anguillae]
MHSHYLVLLICTAFLIGCENATPPQQTTPKLNKTVSSQPNSLDEYPYMEHLIAPAQLLSWQEDPQIEVILIDVRKKEAYQKGHLRGAHHLWRPDIRSTAFPFGGMMLEKEALAKIMGALGATAKSKIVLYDAKGNPDAARLWWMLSVYGHSNTYLLNGGLLNSPKGWISQAPTPKKAAKFTFADKKRPELEANQAEVLAAIDNDDVFLLDCRSLDEFTGKTIKDGAFRAGHIPSAVHLEYSEAIAYEHSCIFRTLKELTIRFKKIPKDKKIIVYCQSGVRSAHTTFVLRELLGYSDVANYDGSWIEWSYHKNLPISVGL